jgi:YhcH/YjgK/YiaL family protein
MILDQIDNTRLYVGLHARFAKAFEILTDKTLSQKQDGKYAVDGDNIYYTLQRYTTKPLSEGKLEAHRKYIDIQFLLAGVEVLGYTPLKGLTISEEYNPAKDIAFYKTPEQLTEVILEPGLSCILFPDDAHLPCRQLAGPTKVCKVVIKIKMKG